MKKIDYVYFTIYAYCSRQSYFADSLVVRLQSMYMLAISAGGWLLFFQMLFLRYVKNVWFSSQPVAMLYALTVYAGVTALFHRIFIVKERDQKIFNRYVDAWQNNPNKKRDLLIASFVTALPYILTLGLKMFLPR